jgi:Fur family peroxide stress response transcriptional regulator
MEARKHSRKRDAMLEVLRGTKSHPSADWIYAQLKPVYPDLSLATVYRNLSLFKTEGLVRSVGVVDGQERYDAITSVHPHFICTCCGEVSDIPGLETPSLDVSERLGAEITGCDLTYYGKCRKCLEAGKSARA